ncbi:MAG TPA: hypothetical protein VGB53_01635 [Rubricoccaceae bacterium]|jgi:hypothetical protein
MPAPKTPNTAPARIKKAQNRRAAAAATGTLDDVKLKLWTAIERVDGLMTDADTQTVLKATHALVQACGAYTKVLEVGEIEARLAGVEARLAESAPAPAAPPLRRVG